MSTRLARGLGLLMLLVFAVVALLTVTLMRGFLIHQVDNQLAQESTETVLAVRGGHPLPAPPRHWLNGIVRLDPDGALVAEPGGAVPAPALASLRRLLTAAPAGPEPWYGEIVSPDSAEYRAMITPLGDARYLVIAAPRDGVEHTAARLLIVEVLAFTAALAVIVIAGGTILRRGLRPLSTMAATAHRIASTDLGGSDPAVGLRAGGSGGGAEIVELRNAFNHMLAHIDASLASRAAAEARLRTFVADASHELRTPLTSIRGYADLFQYAAANQPAERDAHLARLRAETARMGDLLDDLLLLARLDAQSPYRPAETDLRTVVEEGVASYHAAYPEHPISTALAGDAVVDGDPGALRRALDNLLTNTAAHTPAGTPVQVRLDVVGDRVRLRVRDGGPGIPPEAMGRVFDRFYRVDNARSRNTSASGTGLGLAITDGIVRAHHGSVEVHSEPGETTFTIWLPRHVAAPTG